MKSIVNRIVVVLMVGALTSVAAFAKVHKHSVIFENDTKVGGTVVKKGTYDLKFDDKTGELSIVKNGKVIARATTTSAKRDRKAQTLELKSTLNRGETELVSVAFGGSDENHVINGSQAAANANKE